MKNIRRIVWGLVLVAAAVIMALNSFGIISFDLFFDGWWTLFIIVPSVAALLEGKFIDGIQGIGIGIIFLLCAQGVIDWDMIWKLALPIIIALIGIRMIFSSFRKNKAHKIVEEIKIESRDLQDGVAVFCGTELNFDNVVFDGANLTAVFGGIECDLRGAIIDRDCVIKVSCVFGGIDIKVPSNVKVVSNTTCIFGGLDINKTNNNCTHTLYIEGACVFGGIDVD